MKKALEKCSIVQDNYIPKKELNSYAIAACGQGMIYAMMSAYISDFYTNILLISPIFVFVLMLAARVWDAINDPIMGILIDRTRTKWGKMKPYLIFTPIPVCILTILLFYAPNISSTGKIIYASITYILWGMIYTICDVPFWGIINLLTPNPQERGRAISIAKTVNGIGAAIPQILIIIVPLIVAIFLDKNGMSDTKYQWLQYKYSYFIIAIFISILGMLLFARFFFFAKERVIPIKKEKIPTKLVLRAMKKNKPLILVVIMGIISFPRYMIQAGAIHVARYSFSNISIGNTLLIFGITVAAGTFLTMLFLPKFFKKYNYKQIVIFSGLLGFFTDIIMFFVGFSILDKSYILYLIMPFLFISGIPLGTYGVVSYAMIADSIDYMEWKTGYRLDGLGFSFQTFINKLGNAFATSFVVLMYAIINLNPIEFVEGAIPITNSIQTNMYALITIYPAIGFLISIIPIFFYDFVGEKKDRIIKELNEKRATINKL